MSTRSNIILVTPDNKVHQFYHHCDGYLSGVGEELRNKLVYSLGMNTLIKDKPLYDFLVVEITRDNDYEDGDDDIARIVIKQNEEGVDTEERIVKLKKYIDENYE